MEVEEQAPVHDRLGRREQDVTGAAELDEQVSLPNEAGRERRRDVVGAAGDDRDPRTKAGLGSGRRSYGADNLVGSSDRRQERRVEPGSLTDVRRPGAGAEVVKAALERPVRFDGRHPVSIRAIVS